MPNPHVRQLRTLRDQLTDFRRRNVTAFLQVDTPDRAATADAVVRAQERIDLIDRMILDEVSLAKTKKGGVTQIDA